MMNFTASDNMKRWSLTDFAIISSIFAIILFSYLPFKQILSEFSIENTLSLSNLEYTLLLYLLILGTLISLAGIFVYLSEKHLWKLLLLLSLISIPFLFLEIYYSFFILSILISLSYLDATKLDDKKVGFLRMYGIAKKYFSIFLLVFFILVGIQNFVSYKTYAHLLVSNIYNQSLSVLGENLDELNSQYKQAILQSFSYGYNLSCYDLAVYYRDSGRYDVVNEIYNVCTSKYSSRVEEFNEKMSEALGHQEKLSLKYVNTMIEKIIKDYGVLLYILLIFLGYSLLSFVTSITLAPILGMVLYIIRK